MEIQDMVRVSFECIIDSPGSWYFSAWRLKRAAEEIDTNSLPGRGFTNGQAVGRDADLYWLIPVYKYLMGQAFENLIKGIIIAHGSPAGKDGKLDKALMSHDFKKLVKKIDSARLSLTTEEQNLLFDLQQYIQWAGRYPIPLSADDHKIALGTSSNQHRMEIELWEKLSQHLHDNGWYKKDHNRKIYLSAQAAKVDMSS